MRRNEGVLRKMTVYIASLSDQLLTGCYVYCPNQIYKKFTLHKKIILCLILSSSIKYIAAKNSLNIKYIAALNI